MRSVRIVSPRATALLLVLMFIFADLSLPQTMEGWSELEDEPTVHRAVSYHAIHADTYITASAPTSTYNTSATGTLADGPAQESRLLLRFPMNYTASDTIHEASIDLECTTDALGPTELKAYVAHMDRFWNGSFASWVAYASNQLWSEAGGEGGADRGDWEPPALLSGNGTLTSTSPPLRNKRLAPIRPTSLSSLPPSGPLTTVPCPRTPWRRTDPS